MKMNITNLMDQYARANLSIDGIYQLKVPPGSFIHGITTMENVCGFLIPIHGVARFTVNHTEYILKPGMVLHAGPSMPLSKETLNNDYWEYFLLHYRIDPCLKQKLTIETMDYVINLSLDGTKELNKVINQMLMLQRSSSLSSQLENKMLFYQFIYQILQEAQQRQLGSNKQKIEYMINYIYDHMHKNVSIDDLAQKINMTSKQLYYVFTKYMGVSPKKYLIKIRMKKAKELILGTTHTVGEIAERVGYDDALYFSRIFKKHSGMSPSDFKRYVGKSPY